MKKAQLGLGQMSVIGILLFVIMGVVGLSIVNDTTNSVTTTTAITDDQFTAANNTCVRVTNNCILSTTKLENSTNTAITLTGNFTLCGSNSDKYGYLLNVNNALPEYNGATINATYTEAGCGYVSNGTARTILPYVIALFAVLLIVGVAAWMKSYE